MSNLEYNKSRINESARGGLSYENEEIINDCRSGYNNRAIHYQSDT